MTVSQVYCCTKSSYVTVKKIISVQFYFRNSVNLVSDKVHVQNFEGWQAVSLGGGMTVMEKWEIVVGWVTKVCLKCAERAGVGREGDI